jgi:predicted dehydrogenase
MAHTPRYVILGRGRWAQRMATILSSEERSIASVPETRRSPLESDLSYRSRLSHQIASTGAQIAWLCVPPGPHVISMIEVCAAANVHVVVEKPWFGSPEETSAIQELAERRGIRAGVHYEYCMLDEVESWRDKWNGGAGLDFGGSFQHSRPNHLGISALDNLGSHLLSIRAHAVPESRMAQIVCAHEKSDQRQVWLEREGKRVESLDLLANTQPIIQRFIAKFEAALEGAAFELNLSFALRVAQDVARLKQAQQTS